PPGTPQSGLRTKQERDWFPIRISGLCPAHLPGTCSGGKFVVSGAGEAYDAQARVAPATDASVSTIHMSDQVTDKSAVAEQTPTSVTEMAPPSSTSLSEKLLRQTATLLFILVVGLLTVFGYYASSICITVVLSAFLAILFDPVVVKLERLHVPRGVAAAFIVLTGMGLTVC